MKSTLALALAFAALAACTSTTKGEGPPSSSSSSSSSSGSSSSSSTSSGTTSTSSGGGSVSSAQCQSTCISKVYDCNPDAVNVPATCQDICASGSYTQAQLSCFQSASCIDLSNANTLEDVCPP